jgi:membrane-associated protease RseP (regulator of RpoE activity)
MRKYVLTTVALIPLLLNLAHAGQRWNMDSAQPFGIPSEDSGGSSYLGVDIVDITAERLSALKLKEEQGVEVTMVDQDAPAGKAGIKEHDVILSLNGAAVESKSQLQRMIHETPPGRVVTLGLSRDGQPLEIKVQLADRRSEFPHMAKNRDNDFHFEMPAMPNLPDFDIPNIGVVYVHSSMRSGMMVENLTPQLAEFFGAKNGNGVLVRSVEKGSRADKAGLRAGDVIVRVGDQPVHDTSDFTHVLHSRSAGSVNVSVIREKKEQTLTITLPERKDSGEMIDQGREDSQIGAETQTELIEVQNELAHLQPEMALAKEEAHKASEEMRKSLCSQQKQQKEEAGKLSRVIGPEVQKKVQKEVQKELQKSREKLQDEIENFLHDMGADSLDI